MADRENRFGKGAERGGAAGTGRSARGDRSKRSGGYAQGRHGREGEPAEGIIFGRNAVLELLASGRGIEKLYIKSGELEGSAKLIAAQAAERSIPVIPTERAGLDRLCGGAAHQGVAALASIKEYVDIDDILAIAAERGEDPFIVLLDGVEDPHNLGAIIRTAECAGVHGIILPKRRSATVNATVEKSSAGAIEHMAVAKVANLGSAVDRLRKAGLWIYAAEAGGEDLRKTDMKGPAAVVLGSEGDGIAPLLRSKCDFTVSIPMHGRINSLNVSAAAAVVLFEVVAQRSAAQNM